MKEGLASEEISKLTENTLEKNDSFLYFERERDRVQEGEGQRETHTQNPKQVPGSEPSAQGPMWGSNSQTVSS